MMQLCYKHIDEVMLLDGITPYVLVIENPREFYDIVNLLNTQTSFKLDDGFILSDPDTLNELSLMKYSDIMIDFFNVEFNSRKIQNAINTRAVEIVNNTDLRLDFADSLESFSSLINKIIVELDVQTSIEASIKPIDFIKLANLKVVEWYEDPLVMLINYINLIGKLSNVEILFLVNVKQILTDKEIEKLYKHCSYTKMNLVLIESRRPKNKISNEKVILIDDDLCEIDY